MKKKELSTRAKALIIYAIIIVVALIVILFIIPDHVFYNIHNKRINDEASIKDDFVSIEQAQKNLSKDKYSYEYLILDSIGTKSYTFKCKGTRNEKIESGSCTKPKTISYTEKNRDKVFKELQEEFLEPKKVFELLKDIEPKITKYQSTIEYEYKTNLVKLDTTITVETDKENITKIEIMNGYMSYILKYSDVEY